MPINMPINVRRLRVRLRVRLRHLFRRDRSPFYVRRFLDVSTAHLPEPLVHNLDRHPGIRAYENEYGWFMYAHEGPGEHVPAEVVTLMRFARAHGCDYILLDRDSEIIDGLPSWDH